MQSPRRISECEGGAGCDLPLPACGERVGVRGHCGSSQNCGRAPSPGLLRNPTSPRVAWRGEGIVMEWINVILQGVLVGGLYAMFAAGLSLIFGVMRLVNIAHGDLIVLAAYVALVVVQTLGIGPLAALVIVLSVIIQNGLLTLFTADSAKLQAGAIEVATIRLAEGIYVGVLPLLQFAVAVAVIGGLQLIFYRTALGRAFRATADEPAVAQLMGLDNRHVFALAMALSLAVVAIAGVFLAVRANFDPSQGPARLIFGFEAVIIGGLGSL